VNSSSRGMATSSLQCSGSRAAAVRPQACRRRVQLSVQAARWVVVGPRRSQLCIAHTVDLGCFVAIKHTCVLPGSNECWQCSSRLIWVGVVLAFALLPAAPAFVAALFALLTPSYENTPVGRAIHHSCGLHLQKSGKQQQQ
jgi:hypothetical protein